MHFSCIAPFGFCMSRNGGFFFRVRNFSTVSFQKMIWCPKKNSNLTLKLSAKSSELSRIHISWVFFCIFKLTRNVNTSWLSFQRSKHKCRQIRPGTFTTLLLMVRFCQIPSDFLRFTIFWLRKCSFLYWHASLHGNNRTEEKSRKEKENISWLKFHGNPKPSFLGVITHILGV